MKRFLKIVETLVLFIVMSVNAFAHDPNYSCVARADTLMTSKIYQFDIYIYRAGSANLFLNNYQLSFKINNSSGILNGGTVTGTYVAGSTALPSEYAPGGVTVYNIGGTLYLRVNGCFSSSNGTMIPSSGLKIGSFRFTNTNEYGQINPNTTWWNANPASTYIYAIDPPATTGQVEEISNIAEHTTSFTDPIFNAPVTAFNMTGTGGDCSGGIGIPVGLDGSQPGVLYRLIKNGIPVGSYIPGTGSSLSFGNQTVGIYTATAYRKSTYITNNMNGNAVVSQSAVNPIISGNNMVCMSSEGDVYTTEAGMSNYSWNISSGGTIISGTGTNSVTATWNTPGPQTVSVNYTSSGGCIASTPTIYPISVNSIPAAPLITLVGANLWSNIQTGNQWYRENNPISGATGQSYSPIMEGIYWNVVTGNGCMSDTSNHLYWTSVGLNEITTSQIEIYPVPNDGHFTVSISSPKPENFTIIIYSNIGIKIYEAKDILVNGMLKKFFDLRPAPNGFYYVELKTNNKVMISKMIINK